VDLSHQSITGRQFELNRRGYDPDQVDAHLAAIASAVAQRDAELAVLQENLESLEAKVQDANESEEALRLTLKAAAHAKEELLAGARQQAEATQREADEKAASVVAEAEEKARVVTTEAEEKAHAVTTEAESRAGILTHNARAQAEEVARAALAESELLVGRIEELRGQLAAAEASIAALREDANPKLDSAREALDAALESARADAEDPDLLIPEASAVELEQAAMPSAPTFANQVPATPDARSEPIPSEPVQEVSQPDQAPAEESFPSEREDVHPAESDGSEEPAPHLEVVAATEPPVVEGPTATQEPATSEASVPAAAEAEVGESRSDISDKVDRLLEELREVT